MDQARRFGTAHDVEEVTEGMIPAVRAYKMAAEGVIPPGVVVRIGRRLWFNLPELMAWLQAGGSGFEHGWRKESPKGDPVVEPWSLGRPDTDR